MEMLEIVGVAACPIAFVAILTSTFVLDRTLAGTTLVSLLAGTGTLAALLPVMAAVHLGARPFSSLANCTAMALGVATLAGACIAARILPPG